MYIAKRYAYVDAGMGNEDSEENALSMNFVSVDKNPISPPTPHLLPLPKIQHTYAH